LTEHAFVIQLSHTVELSIWRFAWFFF